MRWVSRSITAVVIIALVVGVILLIRAKVPDPLVRGKFKTFAMFRNGSKLQPGSPVIIAGVRVGDVKRLSIQGRFARIDMDLQEDVQLPFEGTFATRRSASLFGDSYVEIIPGAETEGVRMLKSGEQIPHVEEGGSTDAILRAMDRALPKIDNALDTIHDTMVDGRPFVQGPVRDRLEAADRWLSEGHIEAPLAKADHGLERIENGTKVIADGVRDADVTNRIDRWNARIRDLRSSMDDGKNRFAGAMKDTREGLDRMDKPVDQVAAVMASINNAEGDDWKGTLGTLVNDPQLADDVEDLTESLAESTAGFDKFKAWLGARMEFDTIAKEFAFYATAELKSKNDKFYLVEISYTGNGLHDDQLADAPNVAPYTRTQTISDKIRFTLQFGKRIGPVKLRGGLKDSTFGIGADLLLADDRIRLSSDVFGAYDYPPRVKLTGAYAVFRSFYIIAGVDDVLNPHQELPIIYGNSPVPHGFQSLHYGRDYFAGFELHWTDEDISTLLRIYGALLVGLL